MSSSATPRRPLGRPSVLRAAVDLADREGLDAVSMRRLAEDLGVVPMALYKHVADKDDLHDGMVDLVVSGYAVPARTGDWRVAVSELAWSARRAVADHPWLRRGIETRTRRTPEVLGHMEKVSAAMLAGGLSPDLTHHAMHALGNRIWGFSPELFNEPTGVGGAGSGVGGGAGGGAGGGTAHGSARRPTAPPLDPSDYPAIRAIAEDAAARRPGASGCDEDFEFGFALDLLLDALERLRISGWTRHCRRRDPDAAL